ncbi:hypothetical protein ACWGA9_06075 [Streptomyces sp. NPDC054950]
MTTEREWLSEELQTDYSSVYVTAIGYASRFTRLRRTARLALQKAEYRGAINAYETMAVTALKLTHDMPTVDAEKLVRKHVKMWNTAAEQDERAQAEAL